MHNLDNTTGEWACFTAGTPAWHGLGVNIAEAQTSAEAIKLAKQDWTVSKRQLFYDDAIGKRTIPDRFATVRDDVGAPLGVVSADYSVFQNAEAFDFMDSLVGEKLAMFHSAGALDGGKKVWMLAQLPDQYRIAINDVVQPYMLLATSHDGTMAIKCIPTSVRVVCQNTLTYALSVNERSGKATKTTGVSIRHEGHLGPRIGAAKRALLKASEAGKRFEAEANAMAAAKLTSAESQRYFESLFPVKLKYDSRRFNTSTLQTQWTAGASLLDSIVETQSARQESGKELLEAFYAENERQAKANRQILDQVLRNFENRRNNLPGIEHSAWSAYNAVSEWVDHSKTYRGKTLTDRAESRFESVIYGTADTIKQEAYGAALALAK